MLALPLLLSLTIALPAAHAGAGRVAGHARSIPSARISSTSLLGGVNISALDGSSYLRGIDRAVTTARRLNSRILRSGVLWSLVEPRRSGQIDGAALVGVDRLLSDAEASSMRVVLTVDSTPCWASSAPIALVRRCVPGHSSPANAWPPHAAAAYAAFVAYLARRYGRALAAIEVWNEPDQSNQAYFAGPAKIVRYATLLRAAYPAIKQANPNVLVLGGSLVGSNGVFLRGLYAAGIKGHYDALAVHFYTLTLAALRSIHQVQVASGDKTPLWLDEFGWSSCYPHHKIEQEQGCVSQPTQAVDLADTVRALARMPYVAAAVVYKLQDSLNEEFGLLSASGARKLSFGALGQAFATPLGPLHLPTLHLRRAGNVIMASGSGPVGDFVALEASNPRAMRYRALFTLDRFNRYSIALPTILGTSGLEVEVYQYGTGKGLAVHAGI